MKRDPRIRVLAESPRVRAPRKAKQVSAGRELVRMCGVCVAFGSRVVLRDVEWIVREGESWAVVGRNGAGKSALLSLIAANLNPTDAREFALFGRKRGTGESRAWVRRQLGEVSPELHLHFDVRQTVLDAVLTGFSDTTVLLTRPSSTRRRAAEAWLRRFGLLRVAQEPMGSLSAGDQRMVLLARALVKKPPLLLLDEPCQGLDAEHRRVLIEAVQELIVRGRATVIYTSHRADAIPPVIRRTLTIRQGRAFLSG